VRQRKNPAAILFDLGGTILQEVEFDPVRGEAELLKRAESPSPSLGEIRARADSLNAEIMRILDSTEVEFSCQCFQKLLYEPVGIRFRISPLEMETVFWDGSYAFKPTEGIGNLLDLLDARKIRRGVVSNSAFTGATLIRELRKHGLSGRFDFLMSSADYGIRKPNRMLFETAIAKAGVDRKSIWFAGNTYRCDIEGALAAGLTPVWYRARNDPAPGSGDPGRSVMIIEHWSELAARIQEGGCS
jgi:putative hydrolase of the HAD superfamily